MSAIYTCRLNGSPLRVRPPAPDEAAVVEMIRAVRARPTRFSLLKLMAQSPWDYLRAAAEALDDGDETLASKLGAGPGRDRETALRLGTAVHRMVLGSAHLVVVYDREAADAYSPPKTAKTARSKEGKHRGVAALLDPQPAAPAEEPEPATKRVTRAGAAWEAYRAEHEALDHTILLAREYAETRAMADMLLRSARACEWLFDDTDIEDRIDWQLQGRAIRSTPDARRPGRWVVDLKSCQDSSPSRFGAQVYRMLYHAQLETYCRAAEYVDGERPEEARIVAIDRKRPPRCYVVPPDALELGARCLGAWIEQLKTCEASEHFPFDDLHVLSSPPAYLGSEELLEIHDEEVQQGAFQ